VTTEHGSENFGGGNCLVGPPVAVLVMSTNFKNEDTAKSDCFCDFFASLKREGANAT